MQQDGGQSCVQVAGFLQEAALHVASRGMRKKQAKDVLKKILAIYCFCTKAPV